VGVEVNPTACENARKLGLKVFAYLDDIPDSYRFSRVISSHTLEHIPSPCIALNSLRKLLFPKGELLLLLPLDDWRSRSQAHFRSNDGNHHLYTWTPQNLGNLLQETGYRPISIWILTDAMPPLAVSRRIIQFQAFRSTLGWIYGFLQLRRQIWVRAVTAQE
jgi:SAM-dependent methyltransferase